MSIIYHGENVEVIGISKIKTKRSKMNKNNTINVFQEGSLKRKLE